MRVEEPGVSPGGRFEEKMKIGRTSFARMIPMAFCSALAIAQGSAVSLPEKSAQANAVRVIRDPHTAMRWLLERDPTRPGGPGRMVPIGREENIELGSAVASAL